MTEADVTSALDPGRSPLAPSGFDVVFSVAAVLIGIVVVVVVVLMVRYARDLAKRGIDPTTVDAEVLRDV